jgi:GMP synthase-like glutamine amidotransferase
MPRLLFARADEFETFGIGPASVEDAGAEVVVWEAIRGEPRPSLDDVDGVVMFGSSYNVEHADEQPFIHALRDVTLDALDRSTPYLGVCFGAQVLAWSLGADIVKAPVREVGYVPLRPLEAAVDDPVLAHYADGDMVFQWHMDTFVLPPGAELLATGDDVAHQAYRVGDTTWATQFHFEIDRAEIELWTGEVADTVEADWGKTPAELFAEADRHQAAHEAKGAETFRRFAKVAAERA